MPKELDEQKKERQERDFEVDVKINKYKLEDENEKQPSLYQYWSELLAQAKSEKDAAEDNLDLVLARRELSIRDDAAEANEKVTEAIIKARVEKDDRVQTAKTKLREAKSNVYDLEAAVKALEHRKESLSNLTQLWGKGYYAKPDGGPRSAGDDVAGDIRKDLNKK